MMKRTVLSAALGLAMVLGMSSASFAASEPASTTTTHAHHLAATHTKMGAELAKSMATMHEDMMKGIAYADADAAFAAGMIPHHQGAIDMAKIELKYGKDAQMLKLAKAIEAAQGPEIAQMQAWLKAHPELTKKTDTSTAFYKELEASMHSMHAGMDAGMKIANADKAFAVGMIPHHEGAVAMAKIQLKYGKDPEMLKLAKQIIAAQEPEIKEMKAWLAKNYPAKKATQTNHAAHH